MSSLNVKRFCSTKQTGSPSVSVNSYWLTIGRMRWRRRKVSCSFGLTTRQRYTRHELIRRRRSAWSVAARQPQDVLAEVGQDEVVGHRRGLVDAGLAQLALHVVAAQEAVAAMGVQARVGRLPRRLGGQQLG